MTTVTMTTTSSMLRTRSSSSLQRWGGGAEEGEIMEEQRMTGRGEGRDMGRRGRDRGKPGVRGERGVETGRGE